MRLVVLGMFLFLALQVNAVSFDCGKISNATENAICTNAQLNKLDDQLADTYKWLLEMELEGELELSQADWLVERNACESDVECLESEMLNRLAQMRIESVYVNDQLQPELPIISSSLNRKMADVWEGCDGSGSRNAYLYYFDEGANEEAREYVLMGLDCEAGAYNYASVWLLEDVETGFVQRLSFAFPVVSFTFDDDDILNDERQVLSYRVLGFEAQADDTLVNAQFDLDTREMQEFVKYRGIGDAFSETTWIFDSGDFKLVRHVEDPTYDGVINEFMVFDAEQVEPVSVE